MKKIKKKQNKSLISNILFSIIALFSITVSIVVLLINYKINNDLKLSKEENASLIEYKNQHPYSDSDFEQIKNDIIEEQSDKEKNKLLDDIKATMSDGNSAYYLMRYLFPEDVVIAKDSKFIFLPITDELKKNEINVQDFIQDEESKEVTFKDSNNKITTKKGIDVSKFNGNIDWSKVKNDGIDFAMIRVGYRGSTEGTLKLDANFEYNIKNAIKNGIDVGVYFFTQAVDEAEAKEEARFVLDAIEPYDIKYPVAYDVEEYQGRADEVSIEQQSANTLAFLQTVSNAGYDTMIYGNLNGLFLMHDITKLEGYKKWFAYYIFPMYYPYDISIWQYTSEGSVDGISGNVDLNIEFITSN